MEKIKENLGLFFIIWAIVLFFNQIILFGSCLAPACLIAALPHTGIITFLLFVLIIKDNDNKNIDMLHDNLDNYPNKLDNEEIKEKVNLKKEVDVEETVQTIQINNPFYPKTKNSQDEVRINPTQTKSNIRDIPYPLSVPFQMTVKSIKSTTLKIDIDNKEYLISRPANNSWNNISLKNGDVCMVKKVSFGNEKKLNVKLNLLEINGKKNISMEKSISIFDDKELLNLKQELKNLEIKIQELIEEKTEYLNTIEEFNTQYNLHLGELIRTILNLRKEILYKKIVQNKDLKEQYKNDKDIYEEIKQTIEELKSTIIEIEEILQTLDKNDENYDEINSVYNELKKELEKLEYEHLLQKGKLEKTEEQLKENEIFEEEYEDAKATYEEFDNEYEHIKDNQKDVIKLDEEQQKELKILYKKAAKLCHPDIVATELKEKALEIMQSLNNAYSKKDIEQVKKILLSLENGTTFKTITSDIEDKELLVNKIKEFKQNISDLEDEIDILKDDDTFITISQLDDWDEYFEKLASELTEQKINLEKEALEVLEEKEEIEEWIQKLWDWADENNICSEYSIPRERNKLLKLTKLYIFDPWELDPDDAPLLLHTNLPKEIGYLNNLIEFTLYVGNISELPKELGNLINLKKLTIYIDYVFEEQFYIDMGYTIQNINNLPESITNLKNLNSLIIKGIPNLILSNAQKKWIQELLNNDCEVNLNNILLKNTSIQIKQNKIEIMEEQSDYSNSVKNIEVVNFEKIRRYCNNLFNDNQADEMQEYLANNGKMYKAIIYDALEQFISKLDRQTITLVDWGCGQGIASMLVLDYIKEKQLNIKVSNSILIDDDIKALSRAIVHTDVLSYSDDIKISAYDLNDNISEILEKLDNQIVLNLMVNDRIYEKIENIDFRKDYFICLSNQDNENVDIFYKDLTNSKDVENLSIRDCKIGKFEKFERIFKLNDEIPF